MAVGSKMLIARRGEPVIVIPVEVDGEEAEWVFTSEAEADAALRNQETEEALDLAGAWGDIDADEIQDELVRLRYANPPSHSLDL